MPLPAPPWHFVAPDLAGGQLGGSSHTVKEIALAGGQADGGAGCGAFGAGTRGADGAGGRGGPVPAALSAWYTRARGSP